MTPKLPRALLAGALCLTLPALWSCADPEPEPVPGPFLGSDPSIPAGPGEARAGVIRSGPAGEAALFGGINAEGQAGDFGLYNDRVRFIIGAARRSHGIVDTGGNIIDMDLVREDGTLGRDTVEDAFLAFALGRLFHADEVVIVADGSEGGPAVVRASGHDVPWEWMQGLFELPEPSIPDQHLDMVTEYELAPDSNRLKLTTRFTNTAEQSVTIRPQDGLMASGEDLHPWAAGAGLAGPSESSLPAVGVVGKQGEPAVILWPSEGELSSGGLGQLAAGLGIVTLGHGEHELAPGEDLTLVRHWSVAADPLTIEADRHREQGRDLGRVTGRVTDGTDGVAGARVHFVAEDGTPVAGHVVTDRDGRFDAELLPGGWTAYVVAHSAEEHVDLPVGAGRYGPFAAATVNARSLAAVDGSAPAPAIPFAEGHASPPPQAVQVTSGGEASLGFELAPASHLTVTLRDDSGAALPGVIELRWAGAPPVSSIPPGLSEALAVPTGSRAAWAWTSTGTIDMPVLPGTYVVNAGHSWRHDRASSPEVEVAAGQRASVELTLAEVVPRDGWMSMDPHLHGAPSFDGALPMEHRLIVCAATGVDLPILTDHDRSADYQPLAEALGLEPRMQVVPGLEVTTLLRGHFNLFPMEPDPLGSINGGVVRWWDTPRTTQELFDRMHDTAGPDALLQVNHPRSPGMHALARYDPLTGRPRDADYWSWDFELMELLNGGVDDLEQIRRDWFSFLNIGRKVVPTGVSDSHYTYIPCGLGRTDVFVGAAVPSEVTSEEIRAALLAGHVVVAGGTTLRASLDAGDGAALPGDTVVGASAELSVLVSAPDWISPGTLRVYRNGVVIEELALTEPAEDGVRFAGGWTVEAAADAWFVVEVQGTEPLGDAWRNSTPYAMTNAFFLDIDGDGWVAPGL